MTKTLDDVPVKKVWLAQQAALMRLQVYATGRVHGVFLRLGQVLRAALLRDAGEDGKLDGLGLIKAVQSVEAAWRDARLEWYDVFNALRWEAASIPFGTLAVLHKAQFSNFKFSSEARRGMREAGEEPTFVFRPQLKRVMDAANQRLYADKLKLSDRIWRLDQESLDGIKRELYAGVANGDSAWNIAKRGEQYLGAGKECPRWTSARLYGLTKKDIASGDRTGLYSGDECAGQGVAYNALRMTRTEIQAIHHIASAEVMGHLPWVSAEQIFLSPAHPVKDECDDVAGGGEKGDGVYPVGEIILPIHPNCLCGSIAVQMPQDEFVDRLRGWMDGTQAWDGMNGYADWIGLSNVSADRTAIVSLSMIVSVADSLARWLWGDEGALKSAIRRNLQLDLGF